MDHSSIHHRQDRSRAQIERDSAFSHCGIDSSFGFYTIHLPLAAPPRWIILRSWHGSLTGIISSWP
jgi:hypothetical protein